MLSSSPGHTPTASVLSPAFIAQQLGHSVYMLISTYAVGSTQAPTGASWKNSKYRTYQNLAECFNDDATAILSFVVRAAA